MGVGPREEASAGARHGAAGVARCGVLGFGKELCKISGDVSSLHDASRREF